MLQRIRWGSIATMMLILGAIFLASVDEPIPAIVLGLCSISMAVLSLKETL